MRLFNTIVRDGARKGVFWDTHWGQCWALQGPFDGEQAFQPSLTDALRYDIQRIALIRPVQTRRSVQAGWF